MLHIEIDLSINMGLHCVSPELTNQKSMEETMIKMKTMLRTITIVAAGLIACFATPTSHAATTLWVGGCHAGSYPTISAAVAVASPGTTINVCPGYYAEQVTITSLDNLTLNGVPTTSMGVTTDAAVIIPPAGGMVANGSIFDTNVGPASAFAQIAVINSLTVTISHITVDAQSSQSCGGGILIGIYYQNSTGTVTNSAARNQITSTQGDQCGWGIATESNSGSPVLTVSNSSVHNFQKNGIVARGNNSSGPTLTATGNTVIGSGVVAAGDAAQNGIEIAFGATGTVTGNYVADVLYPNSSAGGTGILFYATSGTPKALTNVVESSNVGIGVYTDSTYGGGGTGASITSNHIGGTQMFDGIDLCGNDETATSNVIYNSANSAVHLDDACGSGSGSNSSVKSNTINESCAGILTGTGSSNTTAPNTYSNVAYEIQGGDTCTPPSGPNNNVVGKSGEQLTAKARKPRP